MLESIIRTSLILASIAIFSNQAQAEDLTYCRQGQTAVNSKKVEQAIDLYTRCMTEGKLRRQVLGIVHLERGIAYRRANKIDEALSDLNRSLKINPRSADAFSERGMVWMLKKNNEQAVEDLTSALKINPKLLKALTNRGLAYETLGRKTDAVRDFRQAKKFGSRWPLLTEKIQQNSSAPKPKLSYDITLPLPKGYQVAHEAKTKTQQIHQYVPTGESVKNWRQMITITIANMQQRPPNIERVMTQHIVKNYQAQCGVTTNKTVQLPASDFPSSVLIAYCDNVDLSKIPSHIHVRKNGFIFVKSIATPHAVYTFQYEWQDNDLASSHVDTSGLMEKVIMPMMRKASITLAK